MSGGIFFAIFAACMVNLQRMTTKKKILMLAAFILMVAMNAAAQSLAGRTYYNANIMVDEINGMVKDLDTLRLSANGRCLYGKFDKQTKFKLTIVK